LAEYIESLLQERKASEEAVVKALVGYLATRDPAELPPFDRESTVYSVHKKKLDRYFKHKAFSPEKASTALRPLLEEAIRKCVEQSRNAGETRIIRERVLPKPVVAAAPAKLPVNVLLALPEYVTRDSSVPLFNLPAAVTSLLGDWQRAVNVMNPKVWAPG